jgi:hypothetical protein
MKWWAKKPDEVESAGQGGARVWGAEAEVRIREVALPRTKEERQPVVCHVCSGEPVPSTEKAAAHRRGLDRPADVPSRGAQGAESLQTR